MSDGPNGTPRGGSEAGLSELERDLEQLASDVETLADTGSASSRLVREEAVGAELLAGRELATQVGIALELADSLQALARRQADLLADDYRETFAALLDPANRDRTGNVIGDHAGRRCRHLLDGWSEGLGVLAAGLAASNQAALRLWAPFAAVVRDDWSRRGG